MRLRLSTIAYTLLSLALLGSASASSAGASLEAALFGGVLSPNRVKLQQLGKSSVKVDGKVLDQAQSWVLEFAEGDAFFPDRCISVWFSTEIGQSISNQTITCKPVRFGTDAYRKQHYLGKTSSVARGVTSVFLTVSNGKKPKNAPGSVSDGIAATIKFGKLSNRLISGWIDLRLLDSPNSWVRGSFTAEYKPHGN